ncbi:hypothetical protein [Roseibium sp.]|uniref:hypothetical protein n=1 Tax=Roseibium sp. TaxID=1936156 RepID=UPI003BAA82A3
MSLLIGAGILIYFSVAFAFFTISATELVETGRVRPIRIVSALLAAVFWPLTILILSLTVAMTRQRHP